MAKGTTQDDLLGGFDEPEEEPEAQEPEPPEEAETDPDPRDLFGETPKRAAAPLQEGYVVLARRYRPQTFDEIVGQEQVESALRGAIQTGQIAHAYLFSGPRGTGKTSTARILAKALNCQDNGPRPDPCGKCDSCRAINAGSSLDVIEIDAASNTGVDNIRELRTGVVLAPFSRYKVYIVDEVHMLSMQAFNALLKTLEEPPSQVIFVLATTELQKVPETIVSRCQPFQFRRFSTTEIARQLDRILESELKRRNLAVEKEDREKVLELIARNAEGGMRDAQVALDQVLVLSRGKIVFDDVARFLGTVRSDLLDRFAQALYARQTEDLLLMIEAMANNGQDLQLFVKHFVEHLRSLMIARTAPGRIELIDASEDRRRALTALAEKLPTTFLLNASGTFLKLDAELKTSTQARFLLEYTVIRLTQVDVVEDLSSILDRMQQLEQRLQQGAPAPMHAPAPASPRSQGARYEAHEEVASIQSPVRVAEMDPVKTPAVAAPLAASLQPKPVAVVQNPPPAAPARPTTPEEFMAQLRERTVSKNHCLHISLLEATLVSLSDGAAVLGVNPADRFTHDHLNRAQNQQIIRDLAREIIGKDISVRVQFAEVPAASGPQPVAAMALQQAPVTHIQPPQPRPPLDAVERQIAADPDEPFDVSAEPEQYPVEETHYGEPAGDPVYVPTILKGERLMSFLEKHADFKEVFQKVKKVFNVDDSQITFRTRTS